MLISTQFDMDIFLSFCGSRSFRMTHTFICMTGPDKCKALVIGTYKSNIIGSIELQMVFRMLKRLGNCRQVKVSIFPPAEIVIYCLADVQILFSETIFSPEYSLQSTTYRDSSKVEFFQHVPCSEIELLFTASLA